MKERLNANNFYDRLERLVNNKKLYTSFHVQKVVKQRRLDTTDSFAQSSFMPFVNERDKLGRLIQDVRI